MSKKKKKSLIIVSVILFVALMCLAIYDRTFYDRSKDNIFEIPKAHHLMDDRHGGYI